MKSTLGETTAEAGKVTQGNDGTLTVGRRVKGKEGEQCLVRETFTPDQSGAAKWEIEIMAESDLPWSAPISCTLGHPAKPTTRFWSAWDAPADIENKIENPLRTSSLVSKVYTYGAPRFMMNRQFYPWYSWGQRPRKENYFSTPIVT